MKYQRAWMIYSWIAIVMFAFDTVQKLRGFPSLTPGPYYINGLRAISIIALFGFTYQRKIGLRILWQIFFIVHSFFVSRLFFGISNIINLGDEISLFIRLFGILLLLFTYIPVYYVNFDYAFLNKKIWDTR